MRRYYTLDDAKRIAEERGGLCLSTEYHRTKDKLDWKCKSGHVWAACFSDVIYNNSWCPFCAGVVRLDGISIAIGVAKMKGGTCLSVEYTNCTTQKLLWRCAVGHQWYSTLNRVKDRNEWCPQCAGTKRLTVSLAQEEAFKHGGQCLSGSYVNNKTKLIWQCSEGHQWNATLGNIRNNESWCPFCSKTKPLTIDDAKRIAEERGGACLSTEYVPGQKLRWKCAFDHEWLAEFGNVRNNRTWCPSCAGRPKRTIVDCFAIAIQRNGLCLSDEYINGITKMKWQCNIGHNWVATTRSILKGSWCPQCLATKTKEERLTGHDTKATKAGRHRLPKHTLKDCQEEADKHGGKCLSDHYKNGYTKMRWKCTLGHEWETTFESILGGHWCPSCVVRPSLKYTIDHCKLIAESKGGKCLSSEYTHIRHKLEWECRFGHKWNTCLMNIHNKTWCPECGLDQIAKKLNNHTILYHWSTGEEIVCVASYETKVICYLNDRRIDYMWHPKIFALPPDQNGKIKTYRPDLYLIKEDRWVEVKGYFWDDAKVKWDWFHATYPNSELWNQSKLKSIGIL